jgi:hypothetical protein
MKKILVALATVSILAVSGCSGVAPAPYAGFCGDLEAPVFTATTQIMKMSTKTDSISDMQQVAWEAGYNTLGDWEDGVISNGRLTDLLDTLATAELTDEEKAVVTRLQEALKPTSITIAVVMPASNKDWWVDTVKDLAEIGGACDRYLSEQNG